MNSDQQTQGSSEFVKNILVPWHRHQQFDNLVLGTFSSSNEKLVSAKLWTTREINTGYYPDNFVAITPVYLECGSQTSKGFHSIRALKLE